MRAPVRVDRDPVYRNASLLVRHVYPQIASLRRIEIVEGTDLPNTLVFMLTGLSANPLSEVGEAVAEMLARKLLILQPDGSYAPKHAPQPKIATRVAAGVVNDNDATIHEHRENESYRVARTQWISRQLTKRFPLEADPATRERLKAELGREYDARPFQRKASPLKPRSVTSPPRVDVTARSSADVSDVSPDVTDVTSRSSDSERENELKNSLSQNSGKPREDVAEDHARGTPPRNVTDANVTDRNTVTSESPEPTPRSSAPDPTPDGSALVATLRKHAGDRIGPGFDDRIGAALVKLGATVDLVAVMGDLAGTGKLPGQKDHNPFPAAFLAKSRDGDSAWLADWFGLSREELKRRRATPTSTLPPARAPPVGGVMRVEPPPEQVRAAASGVQAAVASLRSKLPSPAG